MSTGRREMRMKSEESREKREDRKTIGRVAGLGEFGGSYVYE